MEKLDG